MARMTIDEAIQHCEDVIKENKQCAECQDDHRQLIEWLTELKEYRKMHGITKED